jgi:hypothetical protein
MLNRDDDDRVTANPRAWLVWRICVAAPRDNGASRQV